MKLPELPVFFPDATRGLIKSLDTSDIESTKTKGILVNTYHLYKDLGIDYIKARGGIKKFMNWKGFVISDSGGFQVGSLIKMNPSAGYVTNKGVMFKPVGEKRVLLTPEKSIEFQMNLGSDMVVALDDFTDPKATYEEAKISVDRTILWAKRSKEEFDRICSTIKHIAYSKPLILGVVQGGFFQDLRKYCCEELVKIGFDGFGYGGWPINDDKTFDYESAKTIADNTPKGYLLYGLGIGMPDEIVNLVKLGYTIFDCVLPTRDARHGRAYVYKDDLLKYEFLDLTKGKMMDDDRPLSTLCDCLTCKRYTRSYIAHLFRVKDFTAGRLLTIHNLRFYSMLMEKLKGLDKPL
ncbi:MAG: tRNA guanosine(34) transglycosylase Tgt [Candidatus Woesebacteria bacterium]|nr:tRNA guanosine(34) transglycosylase Tgt [Candidatus Woesebacteria bacterium]